MEKENVLLIGSTFSFIYRRQSQPDQPRKSYHIRKSYQLRKSYQFRRPNQLCLITQSK